VKKLKDRVLEVAKIAQECPENLQQSCFEILLKHVLSTEEPPPPPSGAPPDVDGAQARIEPKNVVEESAKKQDDLQEKEIHLKARRFLQKYSVTIEELNQLFYKEGDKILPLYDDLKSTRTSESQIRITLLQCLLSAIATGEFQTTTDAAKEEAQKRKVYEGNNWSNNYSSNAALFDFDKYSKNVRIINLSEEGKKELAKVIKELQ
jgi:hypothetical protein